jgi:rhamnogalacturonyl hydrolase YesR
MFNTVYMGQMFGISMGSVLGTHNLLAQLLSQIKSGLPLTALT